MPYALASRFLEELPGGLVRSLSIRVARSEVAAREPVALYHPRPPSQREANLPYKVGSRVSHPKYGEGVVSGYQGQGPDTEISVNFPKLGQKVFILDYARLQAV